MCECGNDTMTIEKHEAHDTVELETDDYLAWLAREKQRINAKNSCSLMEEIVQMVERHFIVEVMGSRPILFFFIFIFGG